MEKPNVSVKTRTAIFSLVNTCCGAGLLGSASVFKGQGIVLGSICSLLYLILSCITFQWCISAGIERKKLSFASLCEDLFPSKAFRLAVNGSILLFCYGCILSYGIIISTSLPDLIVWAFPSLDGSWIARPSTTLVLMALLVLFPLTSSKSLRGLSAVSSAAIIVLIYLVIYGFSSVIRSHMYDINFSLDQTPIGDIGLIRFNNFFMVLGILGFMYGCHMSCFAVYQTIDNVTPAIFKRVTLIAFSIIGAASSLIGIFFYLLIGDKLTGNALDNLAPRFGVHVARLLMFVLVTVSYPVLGLYVRDCLADMLIKQSPTRNFELFESSHVSLPLDDVTSFPEVFQTTVAAPPALSRISSVHSALNEGLDDEDFELGDVTTDIELNQADSGMIMTLDDVSIDLDTLVVPSIEECKEALAAEVNQIDDVAPALNDVINNHVISRKPSVVINCCGSTNLTGSQKLSTRQRFVWSFLIVASTVVIGLLVPDILVVFGVFGSLNASVIVFVFPALARLKCGLPVNNSLKILIYVSIAVGLMTACVGTTQSIIDIL
ncbi:hypothetical protein RCL1_002811 [Eukaryota sp. TZLM3-RCL]